MTRAPVDRTPFTGPSGTLEARRHGNPTGYPILLLHPHPEGGGTMGSRLIYDLAQGLAAEGYHTVRFNYRGVGDSGGSYDSGKGETDDAEAVWDALLRSAGKPPIVIGHSFGGRIAVHLGTRRESPLTILIGTPPVVPDSDFRPIDLACNVLGPVHTIVGDQDEYVTPEAAKDMASHFPKNHGVVVLRNAGHFLTPDDNPRVVKTVRVMIEKDLDT